MKADERIIEMVKDTTIWPTKEQIETNSNIGVKLYSVRFYSPRTLKSYLMYGNDMNTREIVLAKETNTFGSHNLTMNQVNEILILNYPIYISRIEYTT